MLELGLVNPLLPNTFKIQVTDHFMSKTAEFGFSIVLPYDEMQTSKYNFYKSNING